MSSPVTAPAALPKPKGKSKAKAPSAPQPVFGAAPVPKKKRKRPTAATSASTSGAGPSTSYGDSSSHALNREALDERDDIDDGELMLVPRAKRYKDQDDDEDDDGEGGDGQSRYGGDGGSTPRKGKGKARGRQGLDEAYEDEDEDDEVEDEDDDAGSEMHGDEGGGSEGDEEAGAERSARQAKKDREERGAAALAARIKERDRKAKHERMALREFLDQDQMDRYDAFTTAVIPPIAVKRIHREKYDQRLNDKLVKLLAGMAKIFVADVIELAKDLQPHTPDPNGPLKPYHLRLARSVLEERGFLPQQGNTAEATAGGSGSSKKPLFRR